MSRQQLLDHAWEDEQERQSNIVDVYIGYLRDKVDRPFGRSNLQTVRGVELTACAEPAAGELTHPAIRG